MDLQFLTTFCKVQNVELGLLLLLLLLYMMSLGGYECRIQEQLWDANIQWSAKFCRNRVLIVMKLRRTYIAVACLILSLCDTKAELTRENFNLYVVARYSIR
jgi:hypothetical protein